MQRPVVVAVIFASLPLTDGFAISRTSAHVTRCAHRAAAPALVASDDDDAIPDTVPDFGLLKLPRLTTPERASYEKFRERQRERSEGRSGVPRDFGDLAEGGKTSTPLGLDPVEGDPVDLREYLGEGDVPRDVPTAEQINEANADFDSMVRGDGPDDLGGAVDRLLGP